MNSDKGKDKGSNNTDIKIIKSNINGVNYTISEKKTFDGICRGYLKLRCCSGFPVEYLETRDDVKLADRGDPMAREELKGSIIYEFEFETWEMDLTKYSIHFKKNSKRYHFHHDFYQHENPKIEEEK